MKSVVGKAASLAFVARVGYACWVKNALGAGLDISTHEFFVFYFDKGYCSAFRFFTKADDLKIQCGVIKRANVIYIRPFQKE